MNGRDLILEAAEQLFVDKGFTGTSMNGIAARAGVAKSLIYHHFGSKQDLWNTVVLRFHERSGIFERLDEALSSEDTGRLIDLISGEDGLFGFLRGNPGFVRMESWLNLEREFEPGCPEDALRARVLDRIARHQREGRLRGDVDPRVVPVVFISVLLHWFTARWSLSRWIDPELPEDRLDQIFIRGAIDILLGGLIPHAKR